MCRGKKWNRVDCQRSEISKTRGGLNRTLLSFFCIYIRQHETGCKFLTQSSFSSHEHYKNKLCKEQLTYCRLFSFSVPMMFLLCRTIFHYDDDVKDDDDLIVDYSTLSRLDPVWFRIAQFHTWYRLRFHATNVCQRSWRISRWAQYSSHSCYGRTNFQSDRHTVPCWPVECSIIWVWFQRPSECSSCLSSSMNVNHYLFWRSCWESPILSLCTNIGLYAHRNLLRRIRDGEVGKGGGVGNFYIEHLLVTLSPSEWFCIKVGSCVSHFNVSLIVWAKSQDNVHKPQSFEEKGEPKRIEPRSFCLPA